MRYKGRMLYLFIHQARPEILSLHSKIWRRDIQIMSRDWLFNLNDVLEHTIFRQVKKE